MLLRRCKSTLQLISILNSVKMYARECVCVCLFVFVFTENSTLFHTIDLNFLNPFFLHIVKKAFLEHHRLEILLTNLNLFRTPSQ